MLSLATFGAELEREKAQQRTHDALRRKALAGHVAGRPVLRVHEPRGPRPTGDRPGDALARHSAHRAGGRGHRASHFSGLRERPRVEGARGRPEPGRGAPAASSATGGRPGWTPSALREILRRPFIAASGFGIAPDGGRGGPDLHPEAPPRGRVDSPRRPGAQDRARRLWAASSPPRGSRDAGHRQAGRAAPILPRAARGARDLRDLWGGGSSAGHARMGAAGASGFASRCTRAAPGRAAAPPSVRTASSSARTWSIAPSCGRSPTLDARPSTPRSSGRSTSSASIGRPASTGAWHRARAIAHRRATGSARVRDR